MAGFFIQPYFPQLGPIFAAPIPQAFSPILALPSIPQPTFRIEPFHGGPKISIGQVHAPVQVPRKSGGDRARGA
jgi:hypothetical protein